LAHRNSRDEALVSARSSKSVVGLEQARPLRGQNGDRWWLDAHRRPLT